MAFSLEDFSAYIFAANNPRIDYANLHKSAGFREGLKSNPAFCQQVLLAASDLSASQGFDKSASVLKVAASIAVENTSEILGIYDEVVGACMAHQESTQEMVKEAGSLFSDVAAPTGAFAQGAAKMTIGAGAGLGALYWLLSRHARQGSAEVESLEQQAEYYRDLNRRIQDRLEARYGDSFSQE